MAQVLKAQGEGMAGRSGSGMSSTGLRARAQPQDKAAVAGRETERTEAAAQLERKMAAMEAVLATRRQPAGEAPKPEAARGPGADLRFQARCGAQALMLGASACWARADVGGACRSVPGIVMAESVYEDPVEH
jgi:hypothetical protein